jgi:hypothetical protein
MKKKAESRPQINLLDLVPVRTIEWKKTDELVVLLKPKFNHPFLAKHILPRMKSPHFKIKLDEIGSFFWENCDGTKTVKEIGEIQRQKFGEKVEPLYDRISLFLQNLEKNGLITFKNKD